jgi:uncharacterized RDD family membrane protein YckC
MVSTSGSISSEPVRAETTASITPAARLSVRLSAYAIDSVVLAGFILAFFALAGLVLLLSSDLGKNDPPDSAYYGFMGVFIGGTIISWSIFNLGLARWRSQSAGQYIAGLRAISIDGQPVSSGRLLTRWFGLHPLLFHPLLIPVWALFAAITVSLTLNQAVLALTLGLVALCIVAPLAAIVAVLFDSEGRALHDRLAGTIVVRSEQR